MRPVSSDSVRCRLCGERFRLITHTHLASRHRWSGERPTQAYKERYGGLWSEASLRAMRESLVASHDRRGRKWTLPRLLREIRKLKGRRFREVPPELYWTAQRLAGSWRAALRAARLPEPAWPEWTRERVLAEIRRRPGPRRRWSAVNRELPSLYWAAQRIFGSWRRAVKLSRGQADIYRPS
jgi:hypothetical protein